MKKRMYLHEDFKSSTYVNVAFGMFMEQSRNTAGVSGDAGLRSFGTEWTASMAQRGHRIKDAEFTGFSAGIYSHNARADGCTLIPNNDGQRERPISSVAQ